MWPTSDDRWGPGIESPLLSLQAVDELFSQEVYLPPWGHSWSGSNNPHRATEERVRVCVLCTQSSMCMRVL